MKKCIIALLAVVLTSFADAQVNPHAIGLRLGAGHYYNSGGIAGEVSYQHGFGEKNRLEIDLGWRGNNGWGNNNHFLGLSGIYHWVWNLDGGLNWLVGPGAQIGFWSYRYKIDNQKYSESGVSLSIGGQLGIEYDFNDLGAPIQLSFDVRPMFNFINNGGFGYGGALGVRYTF